MRALLVYPTHENCNEVAHDAARHGLDVAVYPGRITKGDAPNCWNLDADDAERMGFPVVKTVCPTCPHRRKCGEVGYLAKIIIAQQATVAVCTHGRAEHSGFRELCANRQFVSIHENAIALLRPRCECTAADLLLIQTLFRRLLNDPKSLDWFGDDLKVDDEGVPYHDQEVAVRRERLYDFCLHMAEIVDDLQVRLDEAEQLTEWVVPPVRSRPPGIERLLFGMCRFLGLPFRGGAWRFVLAASAGELTSAAILVATQHASDKRKAQSHLTVAGKSLIGFRYNPPSFACTTWFNDATVTADVLTSVLNHSVQNKTPPGRIELQKKAVQVLRDITRQTLPQSVAGIIRGVLTDRPQFTRVGIITHRPHIKSILSLEPEFRQRIVKTSYFGSGDERSSNAWHRECDFIVVAGTPRLRPDAIRDYLIQIGRVGAAARGAEWGPIRWIGQTESGERVTVATGGYLDAEWRQAYLDLVRASLVQAIGRGRGILADGCEVLVLSNEECGIPISDSEVTPLNLTELSVLSELKRATAVSPINTYIAKTAVSTETIASAIGLSVRRTRVILSSLDERGLVVRVGERGGWLPFNNGGSDVTYGDA